MKKLRELTEREIFHICVNHLCDECPFRIVFGYKGFPIRIIDICIIEDDLQDTFADMEIEVDEDENIK